MSVVKYLHSLYLIIGEVVIVCKFFYSNLSNNEYEIEFINMQVSSQLM